MYDAINVIINITSANEVGEVPGTVVIAVCLSVCAQFKMLLTDLNQIKWKGRTWATEEVL